MKARIDNMVMVEQEVIARNDKAHERIEKAIEMHRKERMDQLEKLERRLVNEIRRNGNGNHRGSV